MMEQMLPHHLSSSKWQCIFVISTTPDSQPSKLQSKQIFTKLELPLCCSSQIHSIYSCCTSPYPNFNFISHQHQRTKDTTNRKDRLYALTREVSNDHLDPVMNSLGTDQINELYGGTLQYLQSVATTAPDATPQTSTPAQEPTLPLPPSTRTSTSVKKALAIDKVFNSICWS
jgi:hypothetical protein